MPSKPIILALGYEARSGKDACCQHLAKHIKGYSVLHTGFAKALRAEVDAEVRQIMADNFIPAREAMKALCEREDVTYDPFAPIESSYPFGKQRILIQHWGMKRRLENADYWIERIEAEIAHVQPDVVLLSDLRFVNEFEWVKQQGGYTVEVIRPGDSPLSEQAASHISENALEEAPFDLIIVNEGTLQDLHEDAEQVFNFILHSSLS